MMQRRTVSTWFGIVALGAIAASSFFLPRTITVPTALAGASPDEVRLPGVVRDFSAAHPDFDVVPSAGYGHYAGNAQLRLGAGYRPVFAGGPGEPGSGGLAVAGKLTGANPGTVFDGYDSSAGPYGGLNAGLTITISSNATTSNIINLADVTVTGDVRCGPGGDPGTAITASGCTISGVIDALGSAVTMPTVTAPTGMGPSVGDVNYVGVTDVLAADVHCDNFIVDGGAVLDISGNVTVYAEGQFKVSASEVRLLPGATLTLFVGGDLKLENAAKLNENTGDPSLVREYHLNPGSDNIKVDGGSVLCGYVEGPGGELTVVASQFYGRFVGGACKAQSGAGIHIDVKGAGTGTGGYKVDAEWEDDGANPIAPHLFSPTGGTGAAGVRVAETMSLSKGLIDSFDSSLGEYGLAGNDSGDATISTNSTAAAAIFVASDFTVTGDAFAGPGGDPGTVVDNQGTITGAIGTLAAAYPMPVVVPPGDAVVGPNLGNVSYQDDPFTINGNMHVDDLRISNDAVVTIDGNVTILVEGHFTTETLGVLFVGPGSSLDLYVMGDVTIKTKSSWSDPTNTRLFVVGTPSMKIETEAGFYGTIIAPDATLVMKTKANLYGSFIGRALATETEAEIHVDRAGVAGGEDACGNALADVAGTTGPTSSGGITSVDTYDQWFRDVLGVNQSIGHTITLVRDGGGVYGYLDNEFTPVDDRLLGNEGDANNNHFTYVIRATFTYNECWQQFVEFEGGDGAWLFIDHELVLDIGGAGALDRQFIALDRLGLTDGQQYSFGLFYAQRSGAPRPFRLRTTLELSSSGPITVSSMFD